MQKGKVPDYLPNKPTGVLGSRGSEGMGIPQGYFKNPLGSGNSGNGGLGSGNTSLPTLGNPYQSSVVKNSALGGNRVKSLPPGAPGAPGGGYMPTYKYGGIGGGLSSGIGGENYGSGNNEQSIQGAQGSSGEHRLPTI